MGRAPCCDKANVKRGPWSPEEDAKLKAFIEQNGTGGNWITLPIKAGLKRCGKSCRLRWINYLRPGIRRGGFTEDEEALIYKLHASFGSRWSLIAAQLPGRTDNDIKNYWNTRMKRKLSIKPTDFRGLQLAAIVPLSDDSARSDFQPDVVFPDKTLTMKSAPVCNQLPVEEMLQRIENSLQSCISTNSLESTCSRTSTEGTHNAAQSAISSAFPAFSNGDDRNSLEDVYPYVLPTFPLNIDHVFPKQMSFSEKVQPFQILDHINKHEFLGLEDAMKQYYPSEIESKNFNVVKDEFYNVVDTAWFNPLISTVGSIMSRAWSPRFS